MEPKSPAVNNQWIEATHFHQDSRIIITTVHVVQDPKAIQVRVTVNKWVILNERCDMKEMVVKINYEAEEKR